MDLSATDHDHRRHTGPLPPGRGRSGDAPPPARTGQPLRRGAPRPPRAARPRRPGQHGARGGRRARRRPADRSAAAEATSIWCAPSPAWRRCSPAPGSTRPSRSTRRSAPRSTARADQPRPAAAAALDRETRPLTERRRATSMRKSGSWRRSSRRAMVILCTSSGPSARRRVRRCGVHRRQREVVAQAAGAVHLDGPVDDLQRHVGRGHLDGADLDRGGLVADGVHHPRRLQREQPDHLQLDAGLGDPVHDVATARRRACRTSCATAPAGRAARAPARPRRSSACSGGCDRGRAGPG